jgi:hypothetical protein
MLPWRDWYHVMGNTYGTWLPGDPRGFRTRWHRIHVEGDYRNPPPQGKYDALHEQSKELLARPPVYLSVEQRQAALGEFLKSFHKWQIHVVTIAVGRVHFHLLAQFPQHDPRHFVGLAKKESSAYMRRDGLAPEGGLWATKCECVPIERESHWDFVFGYVLDHRKQGAAVWSIHDDRKNEMPHPDGLLLD